MGELRTESGWSSLFTFFFFYLCSLQLLLSYSTTDANLQGDLGNTPVILACSINNFEALSILVRGESDAFGLMYSFGCTVYL